MLTLVGDMLNFAAAGILFPLMMLPLAGLLARKPLAGAATWFVMVAGLVGLGVLFATLAPRLQSSVAPTSLAAFAGGAALLAALIAVAGGPARASERLAPILGAVARGVGRAVMWLVVAMAFVQFAGVLLRYVFGVNFLAMQESVTYMHGAVFLLAAGYALLTDDHVRVDIFYRGASARRKALIDFVGAYLFLFPVALLILWTASPYVAQSWAVREGSAEASGIPALFVLKSFIPAFAVLMAMAGFKLAADAAATLRGRP